VTPPAKSRAACTIITRAADPDTPEQKLWVAVLHTVIQDYFFWPVVNRQRDGKLAYIRMRPKQRAMQRYLLSRDFELVCGYAGVLPDFVIEVIEGLELHDR